MKTLLVNGCSWTWGGGFDSVTDEQRLEIVWPHHLMKLMNYDKNVNLSMGCGSNQRIVRTTLDWILKQDRETLNNTLAVIQWTDVSRYEYYSVFSEPEKYNNWNWSNNPDNWVFVKAGVCMLPNQSIDSWEMKHSQLRYKTYSDLEGLYNFITQFTALAHIFNMYGIKYYYWNPLGIPLINFPEPLRTHSLNNFKWVNADHNLWDYPRISKVDPHPSKEGHETIAKLIYSEL